MAKNAITDFSTTAASNTDVGGVDIQGTAPASNMDDSVREVMSILADTNAGTAPWADTMTIGDNGDLTKEVRFELSGITTATTRVLTVPNSDGTILTNTANPTLASLEGLTLAQGTTLYATAADTLAALAKGTAGQFYVMNAGATAPEWASRPTLVSLEGLSLVAGDVLYATAADTLARLAKGTAGQHLVMNAGATAPEWSDGNPLTAGTAQASTSGTSIDFTSIPSWVKRITIMLAGVSTSGTSTPIIQIGDSGGIEATGYLGAAGLISTGTAVANYTTGFGITDSHAAAAVLHGQIILSLLNAATNTWVSSSTVGNSTAVVSIGAGAKSLSAALDRVRITTVNGTDTFDAGSVNILYE